MEQNYSNTRGFLSDTDLSENLITRARRKRAGKYIDLTSSNPTHHQLLFPADVLRTAAEVYWQERRYEPDPKGIFAAREAIAAYYMRREPAFSVSPDDVVVTASTSEAYSLLFALLTEPGDNVLAPDITYPLFEHLALLHHVELRSYRLIEEAGWQIDETSLLRAADARTRAILLVSPHNPTGAAISKPIAALEQLDLPVICDEVFADFPYRLPYIPPLGSLHPHLCIFHLNGISKMLALPDLKLSWIAMTARAASHFRARLEILNDIFLSASSLIQSMLPVLLENGREFQAAMRRRIRSSLDLGLKIIATCPRLHAHSPDGGYYLFVRVSDCDDEEELVLHLLDRGVFVHPGYFFNCEHGAHIAISTLIEPETLETGLCRVVDALAV